MFGGLDKLSLKVGGMISPVSRARKYVTGVGLEATAKAARQAKYGIAAKGAGGGGRTARKTTSKIAFEKAVAKRQIEIGRNVMIGGGATAVGMSSLGSNKKSYYNPMPAPKGTGRYA